MSARKAAEGKAKTAKKKPSKKPAKAKPKAGEAPEAQPKDVVSLADSGIVIVDEYAEVDQEKVNEERRAYLEEARSQEASD